MQTLSTADFLIRLATGVGCGALIGIERQWRARMAGLRTNALVATGATLFVLYSVAAGDDQSATRVASYVVSGIGFLGGGVILRTGGGVRGLNTAATLWCSAAVGVMAASGHLLMAWIGSVVVLLVHLVLRPTARYIDHSPASTAEDIETEVTVHIVCERKRDNHIRAVLIAAINDPDLMLSGIRTRYESEEAATIQARLEVEGDPAGPLDQLITRLSLEPGIRDLYWTSSTEKDDES